MRFKHLHRYVQEFEGRHNIRPMNTLMQMGSVAAHITDSHLPYRELVADDEISKLLQLKKIAEWTLD